MRGKELVHRGLVLEVRADDVEGLVLAKPGKARFLEGNVVVVVEVVEPDDLVAAIEQAPREVRADEARRAGDEDFH